MSRAFALGSTTDPESARLVATLILVAVCVFAFSFYYIAQDPHCRGFWLLLHLFILAIALLIVSRSLFCLFIG